MKKIIRTFNQEPLYPFLLIILPVLLLWQVNFTQIYTKSVLIILAYSLIVVGLLYFGLRIFLHQKHKAALISGILIFFYSSYGHLFNYVDKLKIFGFLIGRHRYFLPFWIALALLLVWVASKNKSKLDSVTSITNSITGILVIVLLLQITWLSLQFQNGLQKNVVNKEPQPVSNNSTPDVYYLMFDTYGRQDFLNKNYQVDISKFTSTLKSMGFVIPDCGQSNYPNTSLSMSSMLNMNYLDQLGISNSEIPELKPESDPKLYQITQNNIVMNTFKSQGYKIVAFKSLFTNLNFKNADVYYDYDRLNNIYDSIEALNFRSLYFKTTIMDGFLEIISSSSQLAKLIPPSILQIFFPETGISSTPNYRQYKQGLYEFDQLQKIPSEVNGKKFVFVHFLISHSPFVYTPDGEYRWPTDESGAAYRDSILFINNRLPGIIRNLINRSATPPVIIVQSDHNFKYGITRVQNFNAYYLPGGMDKKVYKQITPVNTFRLVFDSYFNLNFPLIKDQSYWLDTVNNKTNLETAPVTCINDSK